MAKSKKAFSLIEVIAAVALLALGGFAISQACYNMMLPMTMKEKDSLENANLQLCYDAILNVSDYEALDDGIDVDTIDNQTYRVYADFEQTQILDLFELRVRITSPQKEYNKTFLVIRPQWYENTTDRDNLKDDRIDYLEQKRRNDYFSREKMKHKAFTLIETVLAVAISAIVMFAGAQLMYNLVKTSEFFETNWSLRAHADGVERYLRSSFMNSNITKASKLPEVLFSRNKNNLCIAKLFEEENSNRYYLVFSEKKAHPMYLPSTGVAVEKICFLDFIEGEGLSVIWTTNESDDRKRQAEPIIYKTFLTPYVKQLSYIYPDTVWREEPKLDTAINAMPEYVKLVFERHGETITRIISLKPVIDFQISR